MSAPPSPDRSIQIIRLPGLTPYADALEQMRNYRLDVEAGIKGNALFLVEHEAVITRGRQSKDEHLLKTAEQLANEGVTLHDADRGGDFTYHGPGQLVAYPVLDLAHWKKSIRWYLRALEEVLILQLAEYGVRGERVDGLTGVWVDGGKVAAIGVGIHNWVTYHGIALNVSPNFAHFGLIVPCGIADKPVTSLDKLLDEPPHMEQIARDFERVFLGYFQEWVPEG
jgi:lipoate-protein ligase B